MSVLTPTINATGSVSGPPLLTAEEFVQRYPNNRVELVRGFVNELPMPDSVHGFMCVDLAYYFKQFCLEHDFGRVSSNDSFIRVRRDPDTVRGPDIALYSYARLPKGRVSRGLLDVMPDMVVEVKSPSNRWNQLLIKMGEYIEAGIQVVIIADEEQQTINIYRPDAPPETLRISDTLTLPDLLPGFAVPLAKLFG